MASLSPPFVFPLGGDPEDFLTEGEDCDFYTHGKSSLPKFLFQTNPEGEELLRAFEAIFCANKDQIDFWYGSSFITAAESFWLDQHARDRGTTRQNNESDEALRIRIRTIQDAVNRQSLIDAARQALEAEGITIPPGYPGLVEVRRDRGFFRTDTATGRKDSYMSRGYRMGRSGTPNTIIVIVPYGTTDAAYDSVYEAVRKKKAGGIYHIVERRTSP